MTICAVNILEPRVKSLFTVCVSLSLQCSRFPDHFCKQIIAIARICLKNREGNLNQTSLKKNLCVVVNFHPWYTLVFPFVGKLLMIIKQRKIPDCTNDKMFEP